MTLCKGQINTISLELLNHPIGELKATLSRGQKQIDVSIELLEYCENTHLFNAEIDCNDRGNYLLTILSGDIELYSNTVYIQ